MKTFILSLITLLSLSSGASAGTSNIPLRLSDLSLTPISGEVSVNHPSPVCHAGISCATLTEVYIDFSLHGCRDGFSSTERVVRNADGTVDIFVSALNIDNQNSWFVRCSEIPTHRKRVFTSNDLMALDDIKVYFLGVPKDGRTMAKGISGGSTSMTYISGTHEVIDSPYGCAPGQMCIAVQVFNLEITFNKNSCVDGFVESHEVVKNDDGSVDVYISALNIANKKALVVFCSGPFTETVKIGLGFSSIDTDKVRVHYLGVR